MLLEVSFSFVRLDLGSLCVEYGFFCSGEMPVVILWCQFSFEMVLLGAVSDKCDKARKGAPQCFKKSMGLSLVPMDVSVGHCGACSRGFQHSPAGNLPATPEPHASTYKLTPQ